MNISENVGFGMTGFRKASGDLAGEYKLAPGAKLDPRRAKEVLLGLLADGYSVADATAAIRKSDKTFYYYTKSDPEFKRQVDLIRARQEHGLDRHSGEHLIDFTEFREKFLGSKTFPHQQNMIDLLMGRAPSWLHENMLYEPKAPELIVCNIPPDRKSTRLNSSHT